MLNDSLGSRPLSDTEGPLGRRTHERDLTRTQKEYPRGQIPLSHSSADFWLPANHKYTTIPEALARSNGSLFLVSASR